MAQSVNGLYKIVYVAFKMEVSAILEIIKL